MTRAVIVSTARTPLAKSWKGAFNMTHGATLGSFAVKAAVERAGIDPGAVEDVLMGCANPEGATGMNIARQIALRAGLPITVSGATINRFCSSGLQTIALAAQRIETEMLGQQCGIQDQLCSAYGGINYIEMYHYPHASVSQITVPNAIWWELERRLALVYLGKSHHSSQVHEMVIRGLEDAGPDCPQLEALRQTAPRSRDALYAGDFTALGRAMVDNTEAQGRLHPALISPEAQRVIQIARAAGAVGWKVNGAGGEGGAGEGGGGEGPNEGVP